jgi:hypothetical protein
MPKRLLEIAPESAKDIFFPIPGKSLTPLS